MQACFARKSIVESDPQFLLLFWNEDKDDEDNNTTVQVKYLLSFFFSMLHIFDWVKAFIAVVALEREEEGGAKQPDNENECIPRIPTAATDSAESLEDSIETQSDTICIVPKGIENTVLTENLMKVLREKMVVSDRNNNFWLKFSTAEQVCMLLLMPFFTNTA